MFLRFYIFAFSNFPIFQFSIFQFSNFQFWDFGILGFWDLGSWIGVPIWIWGSEILDLGVPTPDLGSREGYLPLRGVNIDPFLAIFGPIPRITNIGGNK